MKKQGGPCKRYGHTERYVIGGRCVECTMLNNKKYKTENSEEIYLRNKKYKIENSAIYAYYQANREATKKRQTPSWADMKLIKEIYLNCPEGYEVDHIHPLNKGGLHVDYNLQYLTKHDNCVKSDKILY
tara:strand:+ start:53 stop:439 length:387 start_codon:yes stop_codon:yes gene_type:complete